MDNLAHGLAGALLSAGSFPREAAQNKRRLLLASLAVVNLPDLDLLLALWSRETYFFHHRGFTHSFLGLLVMFPLGMGMARWLLGSTTSIRGTSLWLFVAMQLLLGHFFLDFLTSYGTMFLYPFSMARFSYPLMFIVDPLFWILSGLSVWVSYQQSLSSRIRRMAMGGGLCVLGLWGFEWHHKKEAESHVHVPPGVTMEQIYSYPGPLAPWIWTITVPMEGERRYLQGFVSLLSTGNSRWAWIENASQLCPIEADSPLALQAFERYKEWGEHVVCRADNGLGQNGCLCHSLKYEVPGLNTASFGAYRIELDGHTELVSRPSGGVLLEKYQQWITGKETSLE